jgi:hypothetical protein
VSQEGRRRRSLAPVRAKDQPTTRYTSRRRLLTEAHEATFGSASPAASLTSDNLRLSEPRNKVGGVAKQDFREAGTELAGALTTAAVVAELDELEDSARELAEKSRAESTLQAYDSDLRHFHMVH